MSGRYRAGEDSPVLRSTFAPGDSRCQCLFDAPSSDLVREVNDAAGFPYERIVLAIELGESRSAENMKSSIATLLKNGNA